ncbi:MAG: hypothetical protein JSU92_12030 [Deltaproteobacteria bacterium]|nr:MAG: hypothetical protein JSU92_12030 [Deltaproteobacteria bacterium]
MIKRIMVFFLSLILLILINITNAWAHGVHNIYGFGSRAIAMGGTHTALANDSSATYYNAAALTECEQGVLELGLMRSFSNLNLSLSGDWDALSTMTGLDIDELEAKYEDVDELTMISMSMAVPMWKSPSDKPLASMGFALSTPLEYAVRFYFIDPKEPMFLEYTNIANKINIMFASGLDVAGVLDHLADIEIPGVSLGIGVNAFFNGDGLMEAPPMQMSLEMPFDYGLIAGILIKPFQTLIEDEILESIKLGVSYSQDIKMNMDFTMDLMGMTSGFSSYDLWNIEQWRFGLGINPLEHLTVGIDATRFTWSDYKPPYMEMGEGPFKDLMGVDFEFEEFKNIWVYRVGMEYGLLNDSLKVRGGYYNRPSPVPDQTQVTDISSNVAPGETISEVNYLKNLHDYVFLGSNIVDCDTHGISLGVGYSFTDTISADIHFQYRILKERKMVKEVDEEHQEWEDEINNHFDYDEDEDFNATLTGGGGTWNTGMTLSLSF